MNPYANGKQGCNQAHVYIRGICQLVTSKAQVEEVKRAMIARGIRSAEVWFNEPGSPWRYLSGFTICATDPLVASDLRRMFHMKRSRQIGSTT